MSGGENLQWDFPPKFLGFLNHSSRYRSIFHRSSMWTSSLMCLWPVTGCMFFFWTGVDLKIADRYTGLSECPKFLVNHWTIASVGFSWPKCFFCNSMITSITSFCWGKKQRPGVWACQHPCGDQRNFAALSNLRFRVFPWNCGFLSILLGPWK